MVMEMNRIREMRKANQMSQGDLAKKLGVAQNTLSTWEIGRHEPDNDALIKIADLFGVSIDYLLGRDEKSSAPQSSTELGKNTITIIGRNGKMEKIECTEEQIEKIKKMIDIIIPDDQDF